jgi:hypothetical protein
MVIPRERWLRAALFLLAFFWGSQSAVAAMKIVATTIMLPENDKPVLLAGLEYGTEWTVGIHSVRLERDQDQQADLLRQLWTFVASSTRPMIQKVIIEIHLLDSKGKKIKAVKNFAVVKANSTNQEVPIKMKVKKADWDRAEKVLIKVTYTVL